MAILYKGIKCSICDEVIDLSTQYVATEHFIRCSSDPLWQYSNSAMHYSCFQTWEHREKFVAKYNSEVGEKVWGNGSRQQMQPDGTFALKSVRHL